MILFPSNFADVGVPKKRPASVWVLSIVEVQPTAKLNLILPSLFFLSPLWCSYWFKIFAAPGFPKTRESRFLVYYPAANIICSFRILTADQGTWQQGI